VNREAQNLTHRSASMSGLSRRLGGFQTRSKTVRESKR